MHRKCILLNIKYLSHGKKYTTDIDNTFVAALYTSLILKAI